jgi:hypothetical protein
MTSAIGSIGQTIREGSGTSDNSEPGPRMPASCSSNTPTAATTDRVARNASLRLRVALRFGVDKQHVECDRLRLMFGKLAYDACDHAARQGKASSLLDRCLVDSHDDHAARRRLRAPEREPASRR